MKPKVTLKNKETASLGGSLAPAPQPLNRPQLGKSLRTITDRSLSAKNLMLIKWEGYLSKMHLASWFFFAVFLFISVIILSTPIFSLLFGSLFAGGWQEWNEFALTALQMSLSPALGMLVCALVSVALKWGKKALQMRIADERKQDEEIRLIEGLVKTP